MQVNAEAGQVVAAGQAVMKIADPREKELLISAPESKIAEFRTVMGRSPAGAGPAAQAANLRVGLWSQPGKFYPARIREIGGAADAVTRTYAVRLSIIAPDEAIQLGMTAFGVFGIANDGDTLAVPMSSLYVKAGISGVWLIAANGKVSLKPVTVLQYREAMAFIKPEVGGVKVGDLIVAAGVHKLREGEVVRPISDPLISGDGKIAYVPGAASVVKVGTAADAEIVRR
jgi:multidrug efflux system membrane fusion protein